MSSEQAILATIRTLLALERNYLAEERTYLAEFRTGLTLALVSPPAISLINYFFQNIPDRNPLFDAIFYCFFLFLTVLGIWISFVSRSKLKKIRQKIQLLKDRQLEVIAESKNVCDLLEDCITRNSWSARSR